MAVSDPTDARYLRPAVTAMDTQHLLYGTVKKHRLLADVAVSCDVSAPGGGENGEFAVSDLRTRLRVLALARQVYMVIRCAPCYRRGHDRYPR
eukprot:3174585-Prymnesium_polylepis.1